VRRAAALPGWRPVGLQRWHERRRLRPPTPTPSARWEDICLRRPGSAPHLDAAPAACRRRGAISLARCCACPATHARICTFGTRCLNNPRSPIFPAPANKQLATGSQHPAPRRLAAVVFSYPVPVFACLYCGLRCTPLHHIPAPRRPAPRRCIRGARVEGARRVAPGFTVPEESFLVCHFRALHLEGERPKGRSLMSARVRRVTIASARLGKAPGRPRRVHKTETRHSSARRRLLRPRDLLPPVQQAAGTVPRRKQWSAILVRQIRAAGAAEPSPGSGQALGEGARASGGPGRCITMQENAVAFVHKLRRRRARRRVAASPASSRCAARPRQ
jgi:hypothetical protein